jgi:hypothetical protein
MWSEYQTFEERCFSEPGKSRDIIDEYVAKMKQEVETPHKLAKDV